MSTLYNVISYTTAPVNTQGGEEYLIINRSTATVSVTLGSLAQKAEHCWSENWSYIVWYFFNRLCSKGVSSFQHYNLRRNRKYIGLVYLKETLNIYNYIYILKASATLKMGTTLAFYSSVFWLGTLYVPPTPPNILHRKYF